jgi:septal ring factor EnvC (AmiA/AmiB activator)
MKIRYLNNQDMVKELREEIEELQEELEAALAQLKRDTHIRQRTIVEKEELRTKVEHAKSKADRLDEQNTDLRRELAKSQRQQEAFYAEQRNCMALLRDAEVRLMAPNAKRAYFDSGPP